jgi:hypothetical protein
MAGDTSALHYHVAGRGDEQLKRLHGLRRRVLRRAATSLIKFWLPIVSQVVGFAVQIHRRADGSLGL